MSPQYSTTDLIGLFKQSFFRIPDYQRGYAWGQKQLEDFWTDIMELQRDPEKDVYQTHYTGMIYLETMDSGALHESEKWATNLDSIFLRIVDGQQRLTTIVILLFCLLKRQQDGFGEMTFEDIYKNFISVENRNKTSHVFRFAYEGDSRNFLFKEIFEDNTVIETGDITVYTENLKNAKQFFMDKLDSISIDECEVVFFKVIRSLRFDVRNLSGEFDVQAVFETMNNRGKPLTILEKLKNRLIYLTTKLQNCEEEGKISLRKTINDAWGCIFKELARAIDNPLDEDEFVTAHLSIYRKPPLKKGYYVFSKEMAEEKLFEMFCNKANQYLLNNDSEVKEPIVSFEKLQEYSISISRFANSWQSINNSNNLLVQRILRLNNSMHIKLFLCAVYEKKQTLEEFEKILDLVEKIEFRNRIFVFTMDDRVFAEYARDLYSSVSLSAISKELQEKIDSMPITEAILDSNLSNAFSGLYEFERGNKGFHRWPTLKYLLFEYEHHLKEEMGEAFDKVPYDSFDNTDIEHIIPQNYAANWKSEAEDFLCGFKTEELRRMGEKVLINTLGNLTILKESKNRSLQDNPWNTTELLSGKKDRYSTGSYNEIEISKNQIWTKTEIKKRGEKIFTFIVKEKLGFQGIIPEKVFTRVLFHSDEIYRTGFNPPQPDDKKLV